MISGPVSRWVLDLPEGSPDRHDQGGSFPMGLEPTRRDEMLLTAVQTIAEAIGADVVLEGGARGAVRCRPPLWRQIRSGIPVGPTGGAGRVAAHRRGTGDGGESICPGSACAPTESATCPRAQSQTGPETPR